MWTRSEADPHGCHDPEISLTWPQALAWRMEQHLLEPVGITDRVPAPFADSAPCSGWTNRWPNRDSDTQRQLGSR